MLDDQEPMTRTAADPGSLSSVKSSLAVHWDENVGAGVATTGAAVGDGLGEPVGEAVGLSVVGEAVGLADGAPVGVAVGEPVGLAVGEPVGLAVGVAVGEPVGLAVGVPVGDAVGDAVGDVVGDAVSTPPSPHCTSTASAITLKPSVPVVSMVTWAAVLELTANRPSAAAPLGPDPATCWFTDTVVTPPKESVMVTGTLVAREAERVYVRYRL